MRADLSLSGRPRGRRAAALVVLALVTGLAGRASAGDTLYVRAEREVPLSTQERSAVTGWALDLERAVGTDNGFDLKFERGPEGKVLFGGYSYVMSAPKATMRKALDALTRLRALVPGARFDVGNDSETVHWSEKEQRYVFQLPRQLSAREEAERDAERKADMARRTTLVKKLGVQRQGKFLYIAKGDPLGIWRSSTEGYWNGADPGVKVMDTGVRREAGYLYILSEQGDLVRIAR